MKKCAILLAAALALSGMAIAKDRAVKGDVKKDGTSVAPPAQTGPNIPKPDNNSTKGNVSPNTGREGTKDPYAVPLLKEAKPL